ncbi:MAG TPA: SDR family oxidoreductase [Thiolapillus brandeum]|uniref:SDR family oxidoreductase n=1 Tax=Thiolapillus brandeum TaxID=1076588 RepID=A0A831JXP2_9GAMM|nr:SDR family oxidoreductase [Thiolapillus brandeum]
MPKTSQRSILITGCSSGIGYHVALALQARGYRVFATARKQQDVTRLLNEGLESLQLDLDDEDSIQAAVASILSRTQGKLYALFNNGAYGQAGAVEDLSRATLRAQLETNLLGWHDLTCRIIPVMRQQGEGRIIQNSSVLGFAAMPYRGAYNCSKFALEGLTDTLRLELAGTGIHISLIEPGPIRSRFRNNAYAMFIRNIDMEHSYHQVQYRNQIERLQKEGDAAPFTLGPEAVLKKVIHALENPHPSPRYYVTFPTYLFGYLKRLLSTRMLDRLIIKSSGGGKH